jgi:hypothetical protein
MENEDLNFNWSQTETINNSAVSINLIIMQKLLKLVQLMFMRNEKNSKYFKAEYFFISFLPIMLLVAEIG